ncbi:alpha-glucan water dikinase 2 isoform X1 [Quercus lobata]|uniref:Alpha-glucan water dikinase 2 n=1 Tax=Quercus lobata TaxID=97700 RepID=A0A7N2RAH4_QUELO|nr:alpha-glucan water dikinase 2 isoform X1 [Quercus lobata]XP_030934955.1 alpha-glucan water dikinase 2 isoform X1 [Quercus lobata]XP_030934956.1 alpha-glucan water dikinase 2 isoform X1 [Quercus lobata]
MASSKATSSTQVPRAHHFELVEGMQLQINVTGSSSGRNARIELQLKNCTTTWILHWGYLYRGNINWFIAVDHPSGTMPYMQGAMQTPFRKNGEVYLLIIELRDPNIHAIEFVLKDGSRDRWLKLNHGNFQIEIPENDPTPSHPPIPKDLIDRKAYLLWESRGRPISSPLQQKKDYDDALREFQSQLSKGLSLNELQSSYLTAGASTRFTTNNREEFRSRIPYSYRTRHNVEQWLQKHSEGHMRVQSSALLNLIEKSMGGDIVVSRQSYHVGNYEIVVLLKVVWGDYHILVATNMKGSAVLHWGVSKLSPEEWLAPPPDMLPEKSKMVSGACQTYFTETPTGKGFFQVVDVNLQKRTFVGIQFVIWTGGSWIKNNGKNFFVSLKPMKPSGKIDGDGEGIVRWLLDEIFRREKEAERSLMHRFNIATELMELCKAEGELGLIGILVWFRFMACRHLTWNKNYNVKPREISEAQDKFTNILQRIYLNQPNDREIVRLVMTCVGRGGQGDVGQRIRDEILVLQRNNDCKTGMMEEWHQKLHNNSSPDDVIICEALLNYVRSGFRIDVYWQTLNAHGLTKKKLASYDRPIVSEPHFRTDAKEGLIRDLTAYLRTLKAVHSGVDLESAIETCLGSSVKGSVDSVGGLSLKLQDCLNFVKAHVGDENIGPLMEKLLESRIELHSRLLTSHGRLKDLLFLDLALASAVRTSMERGFKDLNFAHPPEPMFFMSLVLESLCLSTVNNEDFIYCTKDWYRVCELYTNDGQWALQTKAVLDRLQLILSERSQNYQKKIQPSAEYLGNMLGVEKWAIDIFTEELVRAGSAAILSSLIKHFDPIVRKFANVGCWQVISPVEVCGFIVSVNELITTQSKVYRRPTIIVASRVTGNEEIPDGVVAVLTPDMPDVLSHVAIRARNSKVCFATCFDPNILRDLKLKEGKAVSIRLKSTNLVISDISSFNVSQDSFVSFSIPRGISLKRKPFCGKYAVSVEEFTSEMVGAKSCNTKFLRGRVPSWIKIPMSVALPFGAFETVLSEDVNKDIANKIAQSMKFVHHGDLSKLQAVRESVLQMNAPLSLTYELKSKMRSSRMPWPGDEGEERWHYAWQAIKKVWASKWNERAYVSCKKAKLDHGNLCMAVLVQEIICADYAFVIHTKNPLSGDTSEIYTEIVKGLGETLVGAYPGRAMSFITKKSNLMSPIVIGYPSKLKGLYSKQSVIFRSDSNGEDLEGYAGAGLYDSIVMDKEEEVVLDYSKDRLVVDKTFQVSLFSKIAEAGKIIEGLYGRPQDIEGVVKDGIIYVVQTRPQI